MEREQARGGFLKKVQLPVIGGIRKVITPGSNTPVGTTIAEFGSNTVSLATLAAIITQLQSQQVNTGGGNIGTGNEGTLVPGPGLAGGGVLIGNVPIRLVAPIPWGLEGGGGEDGDPGPPGMAGVRGVNGATGGVGPIGPAIFMSADAGTDGDIGPPGVQGPQGAAGNSGASGPPGTTLVYANATVPGGNTVANTSLETFFTSAYSIPAGSMTVGMAIRVKLFGVYSTGIVAPSLALKIYFGATAMIVSGTLTTVANVTNDGWSAEGLFIVQTLGAIGTIEAQGLSEFSTASTAVLFVNMDNAAPVTVDTTIAENIRASVQWGGTVNASDTITLREMTVEIMSPAGIAAPSSTPPFAVFFGEDGEEGSVGPPGAAGPPGAGVSLTGALLKLTASLSMPNGAETAIAWSSAVFDTGGYFSGAHSTRLTVPATGLYQLSMALFWLYAATVNTVYSMFEVNGVTSNRIAFSYVNTSGSLNNASNNTSVLLSLNAGDYVEAVAFQNLGTASIAGSAAETLSAFSIARIA